MNAGSAFSQILNMANQVLGNNRIISPVPANMTMTNQPSVLGQESTPQPAIPPLTAQTPLIMKQGIDPKIATPYIQNLINEYYAQSPLASPANVNQMAQQAYQYKLHPALMPILAAAETGMMKPGAAGTAKLNPFNVMPNGQLFDYNQPQYGLGYALSRYPANITQNWQGQGWNNFRQNPTLPNFIMAQNPSDNPQGEIENILKIAQQTGVGGQ